MFLSKTLYLLFIVLVQNNMTEKLFTGSQRIKSYKQTFPSDEYMYLKLSILDTDKQVHWQTVKT